MFIDVMSRSVRSRHVYSYSSMLYRVYRCCVVSQYAMSCCADSCLTPSRSRQNDESYVPIARKSQLVSFMYSLRALSNLLHVFMGSKNTWIEHEHARISMVSSVILLRYLEDT
jgi:hypothetical protein